MYITREMKSVKLRVYNIAMSLFQDDGSPVSVFSLSGSNAQDGHLAAARNGVKRLRTVSNELLYNS